MIAAGLLPLAGFVGCATQDNFVPGVSNRRPEAPNVPAAAGSGSTSVWEHASLLATLQAIDERQLPSNHNPPNWSSVVKVNDVASPVYGSRMANGSMPTGSILVEQHQIVGSDEGPLYAMVKREPGFDSAFGDWEYLVLRSSGRLESRGNSRDMNLCARCHADAPGDHVFGPRAASSRRAPATSGSGSLTEDTAVAPDEDESAQGKPAAGKPPKRKKK
ncbi:MAG: hypothetical protein U0165_19400 [Polyangiaceae bacterium]